MTALTPSTSEPLPDGPVGLVLAGGGARGAYEVGALSVLLPELERRGQRPTVIVGNSVGAINAMYLAANAHRRAVDVVADGTRIWRGLRFTSIASHLISPGMAGRAFQYAGEALGIPGVRLRSLLDPSRLPRTVTDIVDFDRLGNNVDTGVVAAAGVVASSALTRRSVVFHAGGPSPPPDKKRLIDYVAADELGPEHVLASTAIPAVFPSVEVTAPAAAKGYYWDGAIRLNTPLKPALKLGAKRIVAIGLSSLASGPAQLASSHRPDAFAGIGTIVVGLLGDQLVQDVQTLASVNARGGRRELVPYIVIAPQQADTIEQLAHAIIKQYRSVRRLMRAPDIAAIGRLVGAGADPQNATLISLLLFVPEFIDGLRDLGAADARAWLSAQHDPRDPLWQV